MVRERTGNWQSHAKGDIMAEDREPKYWGSWKSRVISAIAMSGPQTWSDLLEKTGLTNSSLNKVLAELYHDHAIHSREGRYFVRPDLYKKYHVFLQTNRSDDKSAKSFSGKRRNDLVDWIEQWRVLKNLRFSLEHKHFFLEGRYLDDISKDLICKAETEVLVVNPFVDDCSLSNTLREASKKGRKVRLITRSPADEKVIYKKERETYHGILKKDGVIVTYNKKAHAKLIVIDRALAILSSMNFYSSSSAGATWEAGVISVENTVVESVVDSILHLLERPES
jgi:phosphatidylserine/phosphatidylglycerophosphate/cardiolipin synthase-like enzyme